MCASFFVSNWTPHLHALFNSTFVPYSPKPLFLLTARLPLSPSTLLILPACTSRFFQSFFRSFVRSLILSIVRFCSLNSHNTIRAYIARFKHTCIEQVFIGMRVSFEIENRALIFYMVDGVSVCDFFLRSNWKVLHFLNLSVFPIFWWLLSLFSHWNGWHVPYEQNSSAEMKIENSHVSACSFTQLNTSQSLSIFVSAWEISRFWSMG